MSVNALIAQGVRPLGDELIGVQQTVNRNALANREMADRERDSGNYERQLDMQARAQERNFANQDAAAQQFTQEQARNFIGVGIQNLDAVANDPAKWSAVADQIAANPLARHIGITREQITPENVAALRAQVGAAPPAAPYNISTQAGPNGSSIVTDGSRFQVVDPPKPQGGAATFRPLTPQEVASAGLPPGTSAQVGPDGKIDVISRRDNTGALSQKDQNTARQKLNTVALAKQQLANIKSKFGAIQGTVSAGAFGQGHVPSPGGKAFDAAVNQMRSTLTALTRVPGVGAMSDYETKLDQAKFPARSEYESVTEGQIAGLEQMLAQIENGYTSMLSGSDTPAPQSGGASGGWSVVEVQ